MRKWLALVGVLAVAGAVFGGTRLRTRADTPAVPQELATLVQPAPVPQVLARLAERLDRALARQPAPSPRVIVTPQVLPFRIRPVPPSGTTCYVASGACSLTPCVQFAAQASPVMLGAATPVPLRRGLAIPGSGGGCRGHVGTPKVLRVSGP